MIPNVLSDPASYLTDINPDLLALTGGDDIGKTPERDVTENRLLDHALGRGLPVFGVCRGLQLINAHFGGRVCAIEGHVAQSHPVTVMAPWHSIYGRSVTVNSYHRWTIPANGGAEELMVAATDTEGNVEAICHPEKPLAAVMWHPEREGGLDGDRLLLVGLAGGNPTWR